MMLKRVQRQDAKFAWAVSVIGLFLAGSFLIRPGRPLGQSIKLRDTTSALESVKMACPSLIDTRKKWRMMFTSTEPGFLMALHPKGEHISDAIQEHGEFNLGGGNLMLEKIKQYPGHVVLDCGANIGSLALRFAASGYETHAFEPHPDNFQMINCSSHLNGFHGKSMHVYNRAVGLVPNSHVCLEAPAENMGGSTVSLQPNANCKKIPVVTLDEFVMSKPSFGNRIAVLKIDVEGHEFDLLNGAQRVLSSPVFRPRVIYIEMSCYRWKARSIECADVLSLISKNSYTLVSPEPAVRNLTQYIQDNFNDNPDLLFVAR